MSSPLTIRGSSKEERNEGPSHAASLPPPESVMASRGNVRGKEREEQTSDGASESFTNQQRGAYQKYRDEALDRFINESMIAEERDALQETLRRHLLVEYPELPDWPQGMAERTLQGLLRNEVKERAGVRDISTFLSQQGATANG